MVLREPDDKNFYEKIEELQDWGRSRPDSVKEISLNMSTDEEKATEPSEIKDQECRIRDFKKEKRNAKSQITRLLNKLAGILSDGNPQQIEIKSLFEGIQDQQDRTLAIMTRLEEAYRLNNEEAMAAKVSDEADDLMEQIEHEIIPARALLASFAKVKSRASSIADSEASHRRKEKQRAEVEAYLQRNRLEWEIETKREEIEEQEKELQAVNEQINKQRQELENEIDEELGLEEDFNEERLQLPSQQKKSVKNQQLPQENKMSQKSPKESDKLELHRSENSDHMHLVKSPQPEMPQSQRTVRGFDAGSTAHNREMHGQLERIRIPIFSGNKMDFQRRNAAFTSCVDMTSLSPQFKMLRLEACLAGEAANTIKGLGYSLEAYEAAKARLFRKYGGSRRQVQSHIEELKKLQPIQDNNAKELETFADILERAVITLKENGRKSDLEGGALDTMILEKIPERLLAQYYRWLDNNKYRDSLETLKDWVSEEAAYQIQATEIKNGISTQDRNDQPRKDKPHPPRRYPRSYFNDKNGRGSHKCCVCTGNHPPVKCEAFQKLSVDKRWQTVKGFGLCFRCLAEGHHGKSCQKSKPCGINRCKGTHQNLLHYEKGPSAQSRLRPEAVPYIQLSPTPLQPPINANERPRAAMEGNSANQSVTMETFGHQERHQAVALRTVPIVLKNGDRRVVVNCLLDEGATQRT